MPSKNLHCQQPTPMLSKAKVEVLFHGLKSRLTHTQRWILCRPWRHGKRLLLPRTSNLLAVYLDPCFFSDWGHYTNYARSIHEEVVRRKVDLWHITSFDISKDSIHRFSLISLFKHRSLLSPTAGLIDLQKENHVNLSVSQLLRHDRLDNNTTRNLSSFADTVRFILDSLKCRNDPYDRITLLMYTAHPLHIGLLAEILGQPEYKELEIRLYIGIFYLDLGFCNGHRVPVYEGLLKLVSNIVERYDSAKRLNICSDSERTIRRYAPYFARPFHLIPLPLQDRPKSVLRDYENEKITIGFFGFADTKQGYPLFKNLYDRLNSNDQYQHVKYIVRHNTKVSTPAMIALADEFQTKGDNVTHLPGNFLSENQYYKHLEKCDIIAIPHSQQHYPCQTSGLFTDSLISGKVVIVPSDTWMADQLEKYGSGITFKPGDKEDFIRSVKRVLDDFPSFREGASGNIDEFSRFHSAESLFDILDLGATSQLPEEHNDQCYYADRNPDRKKEARLLKKHPCPSPIYLPTIKYSNAERIAGIEKVVNLQRTKWSSFYRPRMKRLKEKYANHQRCFVIGNGPSINHTDLEKMKGDVTFGVNGIFLKFPDIDFRPSFYVVEDHLVAEDRAEAINELTGVTKLFPTYLAYCLDEGPNTIFFNHRPRKSYPHGFDFSKNAGKITYTGCTVTFTCLQLAFYFGVKEIYLVGVDHSYSLPKSTKTDSSYNVDVLDMDEDDPNHFSPDYFGKGYRWHNPQSEKMEEAYSEAKRVTAKHGCKIYNATKGGKLDVFRRVEYDSLF